MTVLDDDDYLDYNELMFPAYFGSQAQNIVSLGEVDYHSMEAISNGFRVDDHGIDYPSEVPSVPVRWERYLEYSAEHTSEEDAIDYYMNNSNDEEHTKIYDTDIHSSDENHALHFKLIYSDGGQFGSTYAVQNVLSNNTSVYCSGRKGVVNIVLEYNGYLKSGIRCDTSCTVSNLIIKVPAHGFTAPCKEGLVFISHQPIDIAETRTFDHFMEEDYHTYINNKIQIAGILDDNDPCAWFTVSNHTRHCVVNIPDRSGKYVLIKLLRSRYDSGNIDLQYIGILGHSGARSFGKGTLL